jgi:hypothetical protein
MSDGPGWILLVGVFMHRGRKKTGDISCVLKGTSASYIALSLLKQYTKLKARTFPTTRSNAKSTDFGQHHQFLLDKPVNR